MRPLFSVCIPAYNRPEQLHELLESVLTQDFHDLEIVVCEDGSPEREKIRAVVERFSRGDHRIKYFENTHNLGYDANLRKLVAKSEGMFCFFMGNDDLVVNGAFKYAAEGLSRNLDIGVVLRSYATFEEDPESLVEKFSYFDSERFFPAGVRTIETFYRRSVVISGLIVDRDVAHGIATDRFDGTLLYQLYLIIGILLKKNGLYLPSPLALYRLGGVPEFGSCDTEEHHTPGEQTVESTIAFVKGMLRIARESEAIFNIKIYPNIFRDIATYSYPFLRIQAKRSGREYLSFYLRLLKLGFGKSFLFHGYALLLFIFGGPAVDWCIRLIKRVNGATPVLGKVYVGDSKDDKAD